MKRKLNKSEKIKTNVLEGLGKVIRARRKDLKLTQEELAEFAGCGVVFIYEAEIGKETIRLDKLLDVLKILGLQLRLENGKSKLAVTEGLSL